MTNFTDFNLVFDNLAKYFTGSYGMLALFIMIIFMVLLLSRGLDLRYVITFMLPLIGVFVTIGWFGDLGMFQTWILNMALLIVAIIYGITVTRLTT
jgi:hypothetical protein